MLLLGIETSCDETAVALVRDGRCVIGHLVYSQIDRHRPFGGVVPEIASRAHVEVLPGLIRELLDRCEIEWGGIDGIAVTRGPGLSTSLLIGAAAARALAIASRKPLYGVNHLEGHLYSVFLPPSGGSNPDWPRLEGSVPALVALVTGGHTLLVIVEGHGRYRVIGQTVDDAAGEALDKGASLLGLGYPGGPEIEIAATGGRPDAYDFPRAAPSLSTAMEDRGLIDRCCLSYSGLKTSLRYQLRGRSSPPDPTERADLAASYQEAVFAQLMRAVDVAIERFEPVLFACVGGVARNQRLRAMLEERSRRYGIPFRAAAMEYCADNAAMIAGIAGARPHEPVSPADLEIDPNLPIT